MSFFDDNTDNIENTATDANDETNAQDTTTGEDAAANDSKTKNMAGTINSRIDGTVHRDAKIVAGILGVTWGEFVEDALRAHITRNMGDVQPAIGGLTFRYQGHTVDDENAESEGF